MNQYNDVDKLKNLLRIALNQIAMADTRIQELENLNREFWLEVLNSRMKLKRFEKGTVLVTGKGKGASL